MKQILSIRSVVGSLLFVQSFALFETSAVKNAAADLKNAYDQDPLFGTDPPGTFYKKRDEGAVQKKPVGRRMKNRGNPSAGSNSPGEDSLSNVAVDDKGNKRQQGDVKNAVNQKKTSKKSKSSGNDEEDLDMLNPDLTADTTEDMTDDSTDDLTADLTVDFAMATAENPIIENAFTVRSEELIDLELIAPPDVALYLVADDIDPPNTRALLDLAELSCPPDNGVIIDMSNSTSGGPVFFEIPCNIDSQVLICNMNDEIVGAFFHYVSDPPTPANKPNPDPTRSPATIIVSQPTPATKQAHSFSQTLSVSLSASPSGAPSPSQHDAPTSLKLTATEISVPVNGDALTTSPDGARSLPQSVPNIFSLAGETNTLSAPLSDSSSAVGSPTTLSIPTGSSTNFPTFLYDSYYYYDYGWSQLPVAIQAAWAVLGFNESSWDQNLETTTTGLFWSELSVEEQAAAAALHYDQESWNDDIITCGLVETLYWEDIPTELKWAVEALGYDEQSWDTTDELLWPASEFLTWEELTASQQAGAEAIGYSSSTWNNGCT